MIGGGLPIFMILIFLAIFALWIKTIVEISTSEFADNSKTTWLLVVILVGGIGMIIYYAAGRSQRVTKKDDYLDIIDEE
jgi:TRAP-type C4-dicarboxylate transport system permease small subunit